VLIDVVHRTGEPARRVQADYHRCRFVVFRRVDAAVDVPLHDGIHSPVGGEDVYGARWAVRGARAGEYGAAGKDGKQRKTQA
jgi:hypothetical protein